MGVFTSFQHLKQIRASELMKSTNIQERNNPYLMDEETLINHVIGYLENRHMNNIPIKLVQHAVSSGIGLPAEPYEIYEDPTYLAQEMKHALKKSQHHI